MIKFIEAVLILSGMIIGVGMFGIPFSFAKAGFWLVTAELIVLAGAVTLFHLLYGKIVLATQERHRLPGYVQLYLGRKLGVLSWFSALFGISLTLLVYVLLGSIFLNNIFKYFWDGSTQIFWVGAIIAAGALINLFSLKKEALINGVLTGVLIIFIAALVIFLFPKVNATNFSGLNHVNVFLSYGVLLFALSGGVVIPEVIEVLGRNAGKTRVAIIVGTLLPAVLYFLFAYAVVGVTGVSTTEDALGGLAPLGKGFSIFGSAVGFLAVFTSLVVLNSNFQSLLTLDLKFPSRVSWLVVSIVPAALYFWGLKSFVAVMGAVGALAVGVDSALIITSYHIIKIREGVSFSFFSYLWKFVLYAMIAAGVIYELYTITS